MAAAQLDAALPRIFVARAPDDVTAFYYYVPQLREQVIRRGLQFSNGYFFGMPDRRGQHQRRPPGFEYSSVQECQHQTCSLPAAYCRIANDIARYARNDVMPVA